MVSGFPYHKELLLQEKFAPFGSKFFPLREVPILKRGAFEENHYLFLLSPFVVRNFFSVLATRLLRSLPASQILHHLYVLDL